MPPPCRCPFCGIRPDRIVASNDHAYAIRDLYPVADGHTLVIPMQHVGSVFELPPEILAAIWELVTSVRGNLSDEFEPEGFNIGINDGSAAGQTVAHAHIHVIPRYASDVPDPRGGIRWVIPDRADYWSTRTP